MTERQNITIRIADLDPIALAIDRQEEAIYRSAEFNANKLYNAWRARYTDKSPQEVLGMVAFQFAKLYTKASESAKETIASLEEFDKELDKLLFDASEPNDD